MRFGIPLLADRVAPRCTFADSVLVVTVRGRRIREESVVPLNGNTWADLVGALSDEGVETLICGGIAPATRESILSRDVEVIENVAGTREEVMKALGRGRIRPGFGLAPEVESPPIGEASLADRTLPDCLKCQSMVCLMGEACPNITLPGTTIQGEDTERILESTWDVALEEERSLCRLAELVYFGLEMGYRRLGVAFCEELREPATILTQVLRRFFEVVPVGCKVHGDEPIADRESGALSSASPNGPGVPCNPYAMADALNAQSTELNVLVGLCVGADCVFNRSSTAPATTLFVKDKSLANNPIGALYSNYYLTEI